MWAYATLKVRPHPTDFEALQMLAIDSAPNMRAKGVSNVLWAFADCARLM
jgi:hypothetical protein